MDKDLTTYYKLQLAHDLIMYLTHINLQGLPPDRKAEKANQILESWDRRVDNKIGQMRIEKVIEQSSEEDRDVATIILGIHGMTADAVRKEFKAEARHSLFRSFDSQP